MAQNDIRDVDFTEAAWESLYDAADATVFLDQDAEVIYDAPKHRLKFISFGDLRRRVGTFLRNGANNALIRRRMQKNT